MINEQSSWLFGLKKAVGADRGLGGRRQADHPSESVRPFWAPLCGAPPPAGGQAAALSTHPWPTAAAAQPAAAARPPRSPRLPSPRPRSPPAPAAPTQPAEVRQLVKVGQEAFLTQLLEVGFFHGGERPTDH